MTGSFHFANLEKERAGTAPVADQRAHRGDVPRRRLFLAQNARPRGTPAAAVRFAMQRNQDIRMQAPPSKASQLRRNAYYCRMLAADAASAADRLCLMTMRRGWLALAETEDWLNGAAAGRSGITSRRETAWPTVRPAMRRDESPI